MTLRLNPLGGESFSAEDQAEAVPEPPYHRLEACDRAGVPARHLEFTFRVLMFAP